MCVDNKFCDCERGFEAVLKKTQAGGQKCTNPECRICIQDEPGSWFHKQIEQNLFAEPSTKLFSEKELAEDPVAQKAAEKLVSQIFGVCEHSGAPHEKNKFCQKWWSLTTEAKETSAKPVFSGIRSVEGLPTGDGRVYKGLVYEGSGVRLLRALVEAGVLSEVDMRQYLVGAQESAIQVPLGTWVCAGRYCVRPEGCECWQAERDLSEAPVEAPAVRRTLEPLLCEGCSLSFNLCICHKSIVRYSLACYEGSCREVCCVPKPATCTCGPGAGYAGGCVCEARELIQKCTHAACAMLRWCGYE